MTTFKLSQRYLVVGSILMALMCGCKGNNMTGKSVGGLGGAVAHGDLTGGKLPEETPNETPTVGGVPVATVVATTATETCSTTAAVTGTVTVNAGICQAPSDKVALPWALKGLNVSGTATGSCNAGTFVPASISAVSAKGIDGSAAGSLCGWAYKVAGTVTAALPNTATATLTSSTPIQTRNLTSVWTSGGIVVNGQAQAELADKSGWHNWGTYAANLTYSTACACPK